MGLRSSHAAAQVRSLLNRTGSRSQQLAEQRLCPARGAVVYERRETRGATWRDMVQQAPCEDAGRVGDEERFHGERCVRKGAHGAGTASHRNGGGARVTAPCGS
jgi:hypothetical protein